MANRRWSTMPPMPGMLLRVMAIAAPAASIACGPAEPSDDPSAHPSAYPSEMPEGLEAAMAVTIPRAAALPGDLAPVAATDLCVTAGRVEASNPTGSAVTVDQAGMRAVAPGDASRTAELAFTYRGPSHDTEPLANGEVRRQIGLKLRAQDTCNVVYVMWHVDPTPGVFVSVKRNDGADAHGECGAGCYINLKPQTTNIPVLKVGESHTLRAELDGSALRVFADGVAVWEGALPAEAFAFDGPVGVRSDNGRFDFELRAPVDRHRGSCER